jgi:hypothetical protein
VTWRRVAKLCVPSVSMVTDRLAFSKQAFVTYMTSMSMVSALSMLCLLPVHNAMQIAATIHPEIVVTIVKNASSSIVNFVIWAMPGACALCAITCRNV